MGRALTFRASSRGHRGIRAYRDGQFFTQLLGGPMEARDPHVPLSLGRDGSYSTGCIIPARFTRSEERRVGKECRL